MPSRNGLPQKKKVYEKSMWFNNLKNGQIGIFQHNAES